MDKAAQFEDYCLGRAAGRARESISRLWKPHVGILEICTARMERIKNRNHKGNYCKE